MHRYSLAACAKFCDLKSPNDKNEEILRPPGWVPDEFNPQPTPISSTPKSHRICIDLIVSPIGYWVASAPPAPSPREYATALQSDGWLHCDVRVGGAYRFTELTATVARIRGFPET